MKQPKLLLLIFNLIAISLIGQSPETLDKVQKRDAVSLLNLETKLVKRASFANQFYQDLGLNSAKDLTSAKTIQGLNGWIRTRMQQQYKGVRVVGASYILHEKDGQIKKASGSLLPYIDLAINPTINKEAAKSAAVQYVNTKMLSLTEGAATVLPKWNFDKNELVVMDSAYPAFSGNYVLAYHVIISNLEGINQYKESVYIDANKSNVIESISEIAHVNVEGVAMTNYYGEQSIITDSLASDMFILRDYTRSDGVITLNSSLDDFEDDNNFWDNFGNKEEVATDAHYCAASFHDYMLDNFNWAGLDGAGFELRSRVYGTESNRVNATWNGRFSTFFSGDCDEYGPLTTLDVVGHEFAHGFTEFTSGLIYRNESGALNESISDILGKALEFTYDPENKDWLIGSKFLLTDEDNHFRDMADPNAKNNPKLYAGEFWEFGTRDNGGVHINSGVFNFWFHMLSEGKKDVNELGVEYDVAKIGFEKAAAIVFTMNTAYLTESSTYTKAVIASIESVKDIYGENSAEMQSVLEAWKAVGLFPESGDYDLRVELVEDRASVCSDALDDYFIDIYVVNVGANPYAPGDILNLSYSVEETPEGAEEIILQDALAPGDTLFFTFPDAVGLDAAGQTFDIRVDLEAIASQDPNNANGEIIITNNNAEGRITTTQNSGLDVRVTSFSLTSQNACEVSETSQIRIGIQNTGCSEIPEGDYPITIFAAGSEYNYDVRLPFNLRASSFATIFDVLIVPAEISNGENLSLTLSVTNDVDPENDSFEGQYLFLETVGEGFVETFSDFDVMTSTEIFIDPDFRSDAQVGMLNGNAMLVLSGINDDPFRLEGCEEEDLFFRENFQKTDLEMCVNASGLVNPNFSFDLAQFRADALIENINQSYAVMVKVTIEDSETTYPLIFDQEEGEVVKHNFDLPDDYTGEILIEAITLRGNGATVQNENYENGDYALLDNIRLSAGPVSTKNTQQPNDISIYPNPSNALFNFSTEQPQRFDLNIYDGIGRLQSTVKDAQNKASWDSSNYAAGVYFYELTFSDDSKRQGKLVVTGR